MDQKLRKVVSHRQRSESQDYVALQYLQVGQCRGSIYTCRRGPKIEPCGTALRGSYSLATSRLANIFGNGTIYRHDKILKRAKKKTIELINRTNRAPKARASFAPEPVEVVRRTLRKFKRRSKT